LTVAGIIIALRTISLLCAVWLRKLLCLRRSGRNGRGRRMRGYYTIFSFYLSCLLALYIEHYTSDAKFACEDDAILAINGRNQGHD